VRPLSKQLESRVEQAIARIDAAVGQAARQRPEHVDVAIGSLDCGGAIRRHARPVPAEGGKKHSRENLP